MADMARAASGGNGGGKVIDFSKRRENSNVDYADHVDIDGFPLRRHVIPTSPSNSRRSLLADVSGGTSESEEASDDEKKKSLYSDDNSKEDNEIQMSPPRVPAQHMEQQTITPVPAKLFGLFAMNYYRSMWAFCILVSFSTAIAVYCIDNISFVDSLFVATSAYTGSGLSTIPMKAMSNGSFVALYVGMTLGGPVFLLLPPLIYRILVFYSLQPSVEEFLASQKGKFLPQAQRLIGLVSERRAQVRGLNMLLVALVFYLLFFLWGGLGLLYLAISSHPKLQELKDRGFNNFWYTVFLGTSAFCNCGFTLTSDQLYSMQTWTTSYLLLSLLALAGNTFAPIFLRAILWLMYKFASFLRLDKDGIRYALDHPRQMTTFLFDVRQTRMLFLILVVINIVQYVAFLATCLHRSRLRTQLSPLQIAGAGFFQTVSTRSAGLQIFDMNDLNQGMPVLYIFMMYLSSAPFVSRMYISEENLDEDGQSRPAVLTVQDAQGKFLREYLMRHLSFLFAGFMLLCFTHDSEVSLDGQPVGPFPLIFELVSAYGSVGLSMGAPGQPYSLSGEMSTLGKTIIIVAMFLGKHRGLPTHTDMVLNFRHMHLRKQLLLAKEEAGIKVSWSWFEFDTRLIRVPSMDLRRYFDRSQKVRSRGIETASMAGERAPGAPPSLSPVPEDSPYVDTSAAAAMHLLHWNPNRPRFIPKSMDISPLLRPRSLEEANMEVFPPLDLRYLSDTDSSRAESETASNYPNNEDRVEEEEVMEEEAGAGGILSSSLLNKTTLRKFVTGAWNAIWEPRLDVLHTDQQVRHEDLMSSDPFFNKLMLDRLAAEESLSFMLPSSDPNLPRNYHSLDITDKVPSFRMRKSKLSDAASV